MTNGDDIRDFDSYMELKIDMEIFLHEITNNNEIITIRRAGNDKKI